MKHFANIIVSNSQDPNGPQSVWQRPIKVQVLADKVVPTWTPISAPAGSAA